MAKQFSKVVVLTFASMKSCVSSLAAPQPVGLGPGSFKHCSRSGKYNVAAPFLVLTFTSLITNSVGHPCIGLFPFMRSLFKSSAYLIVKFLLWVYGSSLFILAISPLSDMIYVLQISFCDFLTRVF